MMLGSLFVFIFRLVGGREGGREYDSSTVQVLLHARSIVSHLHVSSTLHSILIHLCAINAVCSAPTPIPAPPSLPPPHLSTSPISPSAFVQNNTLSQAGSRQGFPSSTMHFTLFQQLCSSLNRQFTHLPCGRSSLFPKSWTKLLHHSLSSRCYLLHFFFRQFHSQSNSSSRLSGGRPREET